jgi:hypothetical protein
MGVHSELYYALEELGFKRPKWIEQYLTMYGGYKGRSSLNRSQYGGGKAELIKFGKYVFSYVKDEYDHMYAYGNDDVNYCIILRIDVENKYKECSINSLSNTGRCIIDDMYYNKKGTFLVKLALSFIKNVLKIKHNLKIATLKDNATKICKNGQSIPLADMYFLLNGNTWYSILQMNLDCKTVFLRKTVLEAKLLCKNSRVVFL